MAKNKARARRRGHGISRLRRNGANRRTSMLRNAERTAGDIGHWVENQAESVGTTLRKPVMLGAISAAAAGLLGFYLGRHTD